MNPTPTSAPTSAGSSPSKDPGALRVSRRRSTPRSDTSTSGRGAAIDRGRLRRRVLRRGLVVDQHQADLAALVDLGDLDLQLVAHADDVFDLADPLAAPQLADVHQP